MRAVLSAPFGHVRVVVEEGEVRSVTLDPEDRADEIPEGFPGHVTLAVRAYLEGQAPRPIAPRKAEGTVFQQTVWSALTDIPPGCTLTYGELASKLGKPEAARAVGQALRNNPLPLIWPCHRVTGKDSLGGFGGAYGEGEAQVEIKRWLLQHEAGMVARRAERED